MEVEAKVMQQKKLTYKPNIPSKIKHKIFVWTCLRKL